MFIHVWLWHQCRTQRFFGHTGKGTVTRTKYSRAHRPADRLTNVMALFSCILMPNKQTEEWTVIKLIKIKTRVISSALRPLNQAIKFCKIHLFAENINLICLSKTFKKLNKLVNADLKHSVNWPYGNKISPNFKHKQKMANKAFT